MEFTYYIGAMLIHLVTFSGSFEIPSPEKVYPDYTTWVPFCILLFSLYVDIIPFMHILHGWKLKFLVKVVSYFIKLNVMKF